MEDLNDLYFFASVVQYGGFSAAARTIGVEKTRLSRRVAALEKLLGVRLLQRTTRALALTEAGQRFYDRCLTTVEGAQAAFDSVAELRREPAGLVRLSSPVLLTQRCLAHTLPGYMAKHPKVSVFVEPTDRTVNVIEERFDIVIRAKPLIEDVAGLVAKTLGNSQRVMVVSRNFLDQYGRRRRGTVDPDEPWQSDTADRIEAAACDERSPRQTASRRARHRHRLVARTSGCFTLEGRTCRACPAGMVRCEKYSPPRLPDAARDASLSEKPDRLPVDPRFWLAPGKKHLARRCADDCNANEEPRADGFTLLRSWLIPAILRMRASLSSSARFSLHAPAVA